MEYKIKETQTDVNIDIKSVKFKFDVTDLNIFLETLNPLINSDTLWKSHALLLLGDFFYSKNQFIKAKENYLSILSSIDSNNLHNLAKQRLQHRSYE